MSAPTTIASDSIRATAVKPNAVLVTEYMPAAAALVLNLGGDRVWLGTDSGVGASTGLPLEPGAFLVWTTAGELWALLDPGAAASSAQIMATTRLASWEASPAAIGVQVAEQVNALGIPLSYRGSRVYSGTLPGGATSFDVPVDLSGYSSVSIGLGLIPTGQRVTFAWIDQASGSGATSHSYQATGVTGPANTAGLSVSLPVETDTLRVILPSGTGSGTFATSISVFASNRPTPAYLGGLDAGVDLIKTQSYTNGTPVSLGSITTPGGLHCARMLTNTSTASGYFGYSLAGSTPGTTNIYVWKNLAVTGGNDTNQQIALPAGAVGIVFLPTVTATFAAEISLTPA